MHPVFVDAFGVIFGGMASVGPLWLCAAVVFAVWERIPVRKVVKPDV